METASDIIDGIGRQRIKAAYGVADRVLQVYAKQNMLPAAWFDGMEKMAGQDLPRAVFTFKDVADGARRND